MKSDLLTIAIPVWERIEYFDEALQSALNQTVQVPILVIDNASTHNYFKEKCFHFSDRVRYVKNDYNIGMFPNWNKCVRESNTKFICILGDDDVLSSDFVEVFINKYNENNNIDLFFSDFNFLYEPEKLQVESNWGNIWGYNTMDKIKANAIDFRLNFPTISCIVKRELLVNFPFIETIHASNDWQFIYSLPDSVVVFGYDKSMVLYRKHSKSDTLNKKTDESCSFSHLLIRYGLVSYSSKNKFKLKRVIVRNLLNSQYNNSEVMNSFRNSNSFYSEILKDIFSLNNVFTLSAVLISLIYGRLRKII